MKGDKTQTRPERRTPPVTKRRTHLKKELRTPNSKLFGEQRETRRGTMGDKGRQDPGKTDTPSNTKADT